LVSKNPTQKRSKVTLKRNRPLFSEFKYSSTQWNWAQEEENNSLELRSGRRYSKSLGSRESPEEDMVSRLQKNSINAPGRFVAGIFSWPSFFGTRPSITLGNRKVK